MMALEKRRMDFTAAYEVLPRWSVTPSFMEENMSFTILTDTSANLPTSLLKEHDISVIPYHYFIGDKPYSCRDT